MEWSGEEKEDCEQLEAASGGKVEGEDSEGLEQSEENKFVSGWSGGEKRRKETVNKWNQSGGEVEVVDREGVELGDGNRFVPG